MDRFELINKMPEITRMLARVESYGADHHLTPDMVNAVSLSLDELVTNIISYGYHDDNIHTISVTLSQTDLGVTVRLEDDGVPFNPLSARDADVSIPLEEKAIGGLGIHLVKKLMDEVRYERAGDKNILTMTKNKQHN